MEKQNSTKPSLVILILVIPCVIWSGFVKMTLWNWFIPTWFSGIPKLSLCAALGISLLLQEFTSTIHIYAKVDKKRATPSEALSIAATQLVILGLGWVYHYFMVH